MYKLPMWMARFEQVEGESSNYKETFLPDATRREEAYSRTEKVLEDWWPEHTEAREDGYWRSDGCAYVKLSGVQEMRTLDDIVSYVGYF